MDDFSDAPVSIAEARAMREDASQWTPRDLLIALLRRIDAGEVTPHHAVVVWLEADDDCGHGATRIGVCSPDDTTSLGMLTKATYMLSANNSAVKDFKS